MSLIVRQTPEQLNERDQYLEKIASKLYVEGLRYSTFTTKKAEAILKDTVAAKRNIEILKKYPYRIKVILRYKQTHNK